MSWTFGDDRLQATLTRADDRLALALSDRRTGKRWGPAPLARLEAYDKAQFRCDALDRYRIDAVEANDRGVHVTLGDGLRGLRLGVWLTIDGGELVAVVPPAELYEDHAGAYRLFGVALLPGLARVGAAGRLVLPLNCGAVCATRGKPALEDRFLIYGEQSRWELMALLPVAAAQDDDGGLVLLASGGASDAECFVRTDGADGGGVDFGVSFRQQWPDPVDLARREIRWLPIAADADPVVAAAKRLRRHVMDDLGKPTLATRCAESPECAYLAQSYSMKLFHAVEHRGIMMSDKAKSGHGSFRQFLSFAEAGAGLARLRAAGVEHATTWSVGWNPRGHDGLWPSRFPIEERLGGERGLRAMLAAGHACGYRMNVHDNVLSAYTGSPAFDRDLVIHDVYGEPMALGEWGGGATYIHWAVDLPRERLDDELARVKALGLSGATYIDGMGNPLYRNHHPKHRGPRGDYARGVDRILRAARAIHGSVATECGFLYAALSADSMCTAGDPWHLSVCKPEWPATRLVDRRVPLWQLAMSGLILVENQGLDWASTMDAVLMGAHPRCEWSAHPGVMPVLDDALIATIRARDELLLRRFGRLRLLEMTAYDEPSPGVRRTRFADGTEVVVDERREELVVAGERVARPAALAAAPVAVK